MKNKTEKNIQKEISKLFKNLNINEKKENLYNYKLKTKFPTKFLNATLSITNSTK